MKKTASKAPVKKDESPRKRRPHRRREFVVKKILAAARAELRARGGEAFRVERVATAVEVNKTTIYRRWPTKAQLIRAALADAAGDVPPPSGKGEVPRGERPSAEFSRLSREYVEWMNSEVGRSVRRLAQEPGTAGALRRLVRAWLAERRAPLERFARARVKPRRAEVYVDAWAGALNCRLAKDGVDDRYLAALADWMV